MSATALVRGMSVFTRNVGDLESTGFLQLNFRGKQGRASLHLINLSR
jgi:hypothetical protein